MTKTHLNKIEQEELDNSLLSKALNNETEEVRALLERGANPNAQSLDRTAPLNYAIFHKNVEVIELLLDAGADIHSKNNNGLSVIEGLNINKYEPAVKILLKKGVDLIGLNPEFVTDEKIIKLFQEAIDQKDHKTIRNLIKNFRDLGNDAMLYATSQNSSEMLDILKTSISQLEQAKITQNQLDKLIADNKAEINLKDLLEANNYLPDLENLRLNGKKLNKDLNKLDLSGLILRGCKLHNLAASHISFAKSDLTNANITFKDNKANINFADANLTRSYIYGMEIRQANFEATTIQNSMIIKGKNKDAKLTAQQKLQIIDLVIPPEHYFNQGYLTRSYSTLTQVGVCQGLCVELARYTLMSQEKGKGYGNYLEKIRRKIKYPSMNFVYRIQSFQDNLQSFEHRKIIKTEKISNNNFLGSIPSQMAHSDILGCCVNVGDEGAHIFTVIKLRDDSKNIIGYRIFDPNYGDIPCKNEEELNQQVNMLYQHYQRNADNKNGFFTIQALDDLVREHGLIHPKDVNFTEEEKAANKAKKYAKMSDLEKLYMIIESNKSTPDDIKKAKNQIENMDLTQINAPIKQQDGSTESLLTLAVKGCNIEIVKKLIEKKAEVNNPNITTLSPLGIADVQLDKKHQEAYNDRMDAFNLSNDDIAFTKRNKEINDGLDQVIKQYDEIKKALIDAGAEKNIFDAIASYDEPALIMLLERGSNLNAKNLEGKTPLYYAIEKGFAVQLLVDAGADIHSKDNDGRSLIKFAETKYADPASSGLSVEILLKSGADPVGLNPEFVTDKKIIKLFKDAINDNNTQTMDNLLKYHSHFKDKLIGDSQETLLSYAATKNDPNMMNYMKTQGFKPKATMLTKIVQEVGKVIAFLTQNNLFRMPGGVTTTEVTSHNETPQIQQATSSSGNKQIDGSVTIADTEDVTLTMDLVATDENAIGLTGLWRKLVNPNPTQQTNLNPEKTEPDVREYITASDVNNYAQKAQSPEDKKFMDSILNDERLKARRKKTEIYSSPGFVSALEGKRIKSNSGKATK